MKCLKCKCEILDSIVIYYCNVCMTSCEAGIRLVRTFRGVVPDHIPDCQVHGYLKLKEYRVKVKKNV